MWAMNRGTVDLIATDPSLTKKKNAHATPNSLAAGASFMAIGAGEGMRQSWADENKAGLPVRMKATESARTAHAESMGMYMCYMAIRLREMRRLWTPTGSIYLHCDPAAGGKRESGLQK